MRGGKESGEAIQIACRKRLAGPGGPGLDFQTWESTNLN
jgi:hypothetical protein